MTVAVIVYLLATLPAVAVVHYLVLFFRQPQKFWELQFEPKDRIGWRSKWIVPTDDPAYRRHLYIWYAYLGLVFIGLFAVLYVPARELISWIPHSWRFDEDGEIWAADGWAGIFSFLGAAFLLKGFADTAKKLSATHIPDDRYREGKLGLFEQIAEKVKGGNNDMSSIIINHDQLMKALQPPKMKRVTIPKITQIRGSMTGEIIITAPAHETRLQGNGSLPYVIVADARQLHTIVSRLPETKEVQIDCSDNHLIFRVNSFQLKYAPLKIEKF